MQYLADLVTLFVVQRLPNLTEDGEKVPRCLRSGLDWCSSGRQPNVVPILINTEKVSKRYRESAIDLAGRRLLITNYRGTDQEADLSDPPNCRGFGRIRHFRRTTTPGWPPNPLPLDPACRALGLSATDFLRAQVFQNAVCNWRCWYCYVPYNLLAGSRKYAEWLSPADLVELYLDQPDPPLVLDLTGGQPDLTPEWIPWMMTELRSRGLDRTVYLWSDDNLSNDYFWRFLSDADRELVASFPNYGRVCCFKGFDADSFSFNSRAAPELFERQFELMRRLWSLGIDLYAYATFTTARSKGVEKGIKRFVDRLQEIDPNLPLRTVPLEIQLFTPVYPRMTDGYEKFLQNQWIAIEAWQSELENRYSAVQRRSNIASTALGESRWSDDRRCSMRRRIANE
ncbi:MAG: hypothetical protein M3464_12620 [Chloroflexota bacterium]|nr:hypothetical protein [Chloroflexota bacterium]